MHRDSRGYFYRSVRHGKRVAREYFGNSPLAERLAALDEVERKEALQSRALQQQERAPLDELDARIKAVCSASDVVLREALQDAGYHQHARGQWRKRRQMPNEAQEAQGGSQIEVEANRMTKLKETGDKIRPLLEAARSDPKAASQVMALFEESGTMSKMVEGAGNMAEQARLAMVKQYLGSDQLTIQLTERKMEQMRCELCGPNPTPLERLLVERIILCWFHLNSQETLAASREINRKEIGSMTLAQADHYQKQIDRAHKRYLSAIKALATVRKIQLPNVQVNIGEKQVNIGTVNGAPLLEGG
jgi:hypothetical protein